MLHRTLSTYELSAQAIALLIFNVLSVEICLVSVVIHVDVGKEFHQHQGPAAQLLLINTFSVLFLLYRHLNIHTKPILFPVCTSSSNTTH